MVKTLGRLRYFKELYYSVLFLLIVLLIGTGGYILLEGYTWVEAFYMTVITISTVGFGEVRPLSLEGKLFTAFLIITTFGTFAYTFSNVAKYFYTGQYKVYLKNYKTMSELEKLSQHIIVCGYGRNGKQSARTLMAHKQPFVVIESSHELIAQMAETNDNINVIEGDATDDTVLLKAGIDRARALITTLPSDADNLYVVLTARELNHNLNIISRASNDRSEHKLKIAGADNVILPDKVGGSHMASLVITPDLMEFLDHISVMGPDQSTLVEVRFRNLPKDFEHKTILELEKHYHTGARIIGFKTPENEIIVNPSSDIALVPKSKLFVLGNADQIKKLKEALHIDE